MASAQAPTNPFDGFDAYTGVAAPPQGTPVQPQPQQGMHTPQQGGQPAGQWNQQQGGQVNPFANQGALVPSAVQSNPYAVGPQQQGVMPQGMNQPHMYPQPQFPRQQQPVQQQAMYPPQQQQMVHVGAGNAWGVPTPIAPVAPVNQMAPPATPAANNQQQLVTAPPSDDPFSIFASHAPQPPPPATPQQQIEQQMQSLQFNDNTPSKQSIVPDDDDEEGLALVDVELDEDETNNDKSNFEEHKQDGEFIGRNSDARESKSPRRKDKNADIAPPPPMHPGRENAEYLSRNAGGMTSPLPRPTLVVHSGYVLARISFRTVLLRKWKQTFWIQYGPTQLLFFRSYSDFDDWLNNPYHTTKAREYLVKLRVDFVSDLKKKSVMGYQVTQIRRKPYGKNVMLHFKLERWMDYGPTIAAAFAARQEEMIESEYYKNNQNGRNRDEDGGMNTTNDVSALRKIILGCMRNARDAALLATQDRMSPRAHPEYQGRYAEDREVRGGVERDEQDRNGLDRGSPEKFRMSNQSSKAGLYHQAFAAESSGRRKYQEDAEENNSDDNQDRSDAPAKEEAVSQIVDLLG